MQVLYWYEGKTPYRLLETDQKPEVISDDNYRSMRVEYDYWWKGRDLDQDKYPVTYINKLFRQKPRKHTSKSPSKTPSKRPQAAGSPTPATPATPSGSRSDTNNETAASEDIPAAEQEEQQQEKEEEEQEALADKDEGGADGAPATLTPHAVQVLLRGNGQRRGRHTRR
jgi:hypothetical protein